MVNRDGHTRHWLDDYTAARPYAVELLWSDRIQDPGQTKWQSIREELDISDVRAIRGL